MSQSLRHMLLPPQEHWELSSAVAPWLVPMVPSVLSKMVLRLLPSNSLSLSSPLRLFSAPRAWAMGRISNCDPFLDSGLHFHPSVFQIHPDFSTKSTRKRITTETQHNQHYFVLQPVPPLCRLLPMSSHCPRLPGRKLTFTQSVLYLLILH